MMIFLLNINSIDKRTYLRIIGFVSDSFYFYSIAQTVAQCNFFRNCIDILEWLCILSLLEAKK